VIRRRTRRSRWGLTSLVTASLLGPWLGALAAQTPSPSPAIAPSGRTHLVVITGASGEPGYGDAFNKAALAIVDAAHARFAIPDSDVTYLGEDPARAPGRIAGPSTREGVERALGRVAARAGAGDQVWIVLIGHGSGEGAASRFNLPGPDLAAADFARLLAPLSRQQVAFVDASSASGDFVRTLAGPNRAIVTATRSATERNGTRFAKYFADALSTPGADVDKDGAVSLLEAFAYAQRETARAYESDNRLLTEHAQLDDDGDGVASMTPAADAADGRLAAAMVLGGAGASSDPRVGALVVKRRALELQVADLRRRRPTMDSTAYLQQLETVLVDLSRTAHTIRGIEGAKP